MLLLDEYSFCSSCATFHWRDLEFQSRKAAVSDTCPAETRSSPRGLWVCLGMPQAAFRPLPALLWRINPSVCSTAVHYILQTAGYRAIADPGCCLHSPEAVLLSQIPVNCQYCFFVFALFTPLKKMNISKIAYGIRGHMLIHAVAHLSRHMDCHAHQLRSL